MEERVIKLRQNIPPEVFKSIRVVGNTPERFLGNFRYLRLYYNDYDYKNGDILDQKIFDSIKSFYPQSYWYINMLTLFDKQYDDCLTFTKGGTVKPITTYFYPLITLAEEIPVELKAYFLNLNLILHLSEGDSRIEYITDSIMVNIPNTDLQKLIKTIKPV